MRDSVRHHDLLQLAVVQRLDGVAAKDAVCDNGNCRLSAMGDDDVSSLRQGTAGVGHIVYNDSDLIADISDQNHLRDLIWPRALFMDQCEAEIQTIRNGRRSLSTASVGADNDALLHWQVLADPAQSAGLGVEVVDGDIEESLDLAGVQIHGDDMVAAGRLQHVCHQFRSDGSTRLVLLVLAGVGEVGDDGGNAAGRGGLAGVDHDQQLHQAVIDVARSSRLQDEDCAHALSVGHAWATQAMRGARRERRQYHLRREPTLR